MTRSLTALPRARRQTCPWAAARIHAMNEPGEQVELATEEGARADQRILRMTPDGKTASSIEAILRMRIEEIAEAIRDKDLVRLMAFYAHDVVAFDVRPPLDTRGADA